MLARNNHPALLYHRQLEQLSLCFGLNRPFDNRLKVASLQAGPAYQCSVLKTVETIL